MLYYPISAAINALTAIGLGSFIMFGSARKQMHRAFVYFTAAVAFWSTAYFFWQISTTSETALFWSRMLMAGAIYTPITYLHFVYAFLGIYKERRIFLYLGYAFLSLFLPLDLTTLFVNHVEPYLSFKFWPMPGGAFHAFLIIWFVYLIYAVGILLEHYKKASGYKRSQLNYLFLGIFLAFVGGATNYFPWYKIPIPPYGNILVAIYLGIFAYAILVYHLMDIQIIIRMSTIFAILFAIISALYLTTAALLGKILGGAFSVLLPTFVIAITYAPLKNIVANFTDKVFFQKKYNLTDVINELGEAVHHLGLNLEGILSTFDRTLVDVFKLEKSTFGLMSGGYSAELAHVISIANLHVLQLSSQSALIRYMQDEEIALIDKDELQEHSHWQKQPSLLVKQAYNELERAGFHIAVAIRFEDKILFLYLLGNKKSHDMFYRDDIKLIKHAANEIAASVNNAKLYNNLKDALSAKSEFLSVVSHQMRTPISGIRWSLELLQKPGLATEKRREFLENAYHNSIFINEQIDDVLTALDIQDKNVSLNQERCDLGVMANELMAQFNHQTEEKKLKVKLNLGAGSLVSCDLAKIKKVIGVLIKNAIIYTPVGGRIEARSEEKDINGTRNLLVAVSDTGIGITDDEKGRIFDKFYRSNRAKLVLPDGMGLGMFIARAYVEAHGGKLWAESAGKDQGSTFYFTLPIKNIYG